jgi:hypothetical protein
MIFSGCVANDVASTEKFTNFQTSACGTRPISQAGVCTMDSMTHPVAIVTGSSSGISCAAAIVFGGVILRNSEGAMVP